MMRSQHPPHTTILSLVEICNLMMAKWAETCRSLTSTNTSCEEKENQQDATLRCLLSTSVSTCFGHHYAHLQEIKDRVLLHMVYCAGSAGCGW